jgi:hypothetical protein
MAGEVVARLSAISVHTPHQCEERSVVALFLEVVVGFAPRPDIRYMVGAGLRGHDDVPAWWYGGRWVPRYPAAVAFSLFNTAHVACRPHARVGACWIDQQAAKLTPSK